MNSWITEDMMQKKSMNLLKLTSNSHRIGDLALNSSNPSAVSTFSITKTSEMDQEHVNTLMKKLKQDRQKRQIKLQGYKQKLEKIQEEENIKIEQNKKVQDENKQKKDMARHELAIKKVSNWAWFYSSSNGKKNVESNNRNGLRLTKWE